MRRVATFVLLLLAALPAARADETTVAVLPFATADEELVVYARPVADAVVKALAGAKDLRPVVRADGASQKADLVVELRLVKDRRKVRLEGIVRDPEVGAPGHAVAAQPAPLADLDVASAELGKKLLPLLGDEAAVRARRRAEERRAAEEAHAAAKPAPAVHDAEAQHAAPAPADTRQAVLLYQPVGHISASAVPVREPARAALSSLLDGLGYRVIPSVKEGLIAPELAAGDARQLGLRATAMLDVERVDFDWQGTVLTARGQVRLYVVASDGETLFDREIETDTVVGSRGDRHDALIRFVLRQAMDAARHDLSLALRRPVAASPQASAPSR